MEERELRNDASLPTIIRRYLLPGIFIFALALLYRLNVEYWNKKTEPDELVERLQGTPQIEAIAAGILEEVRNGKVDAVLLLESDLNESVRRQLHKIVAWHNAHLLVQTNQGTFSIGIIRDLKSTLGVCLYQGRAEDVPFGTGRRSIGTNIFFFE